MGKVILITFLLGLYRVGIYPFLQGQCRFSPTCSDYCYRSFSEHPPLKAFFLVCKRLLKCHPWGPISPL